jgi:hypothetical protein
MSACDTKAGYPTERIAQEHLTNRLRQNRTLDLRVYHCKACGKYHLTSKPDRYAQRRDGEAA